MPYIIWCLIWATAAGLCDGIVLKDNGYEDINIVIQDTEPESKALLDAIKSEWTKASATLFKATHQRVFFHQIQIIIPNTWSDQYATNTGPAISSLDSPIKVVSSLPRVPQVKGLVGCGDPGLHAYMSLNTEFIFGKANFGPVDQVIVHEWSHLRWGVYDEYPTQHQGYFYMAEGVWKPAVCTEIIQVTSPANCDLSSSKVLDPTCTFSVNQHQNSTASLMGSQWLESLTDFCDTNTRTNPVPEGLRHNSLAPNKHNTRCGSRSIWEVMREHPDFRNGNSPKLGNNTNTDPEYEIYQESASVRVMVLDVSDSMDGARLYLLRQASTLVLSDSNILQTGSWLSLVQFAAYVESVVNMTHVISDADRQRLISALPTSVSVDGIRRTCIGCGVRKALKILRVFLNTQDPKHADIIVISDGANNEGDFDAYIQEFVKSKVIIHTIAISQDADPRLETMATRTGGKHLVFLDGTDLGGTSLAAAMSSVFVSSVTSDATSPVTIASEKLTVKAGEVLSYQFALDGGVGKATSVSFLPQRSTEINVTLSGPNGFRILERKVDTLMLLVAMNETAGSGNYDVEISTRNDTEIELYITSLPRDNVAGAIRTTSRLSHTNIDYSSDVLPVIYADVLQQGNAIVDANVTAVVETASQTACTIQLYDDGQDPDVTYNDGTYAGYIQRDCLLGNGRIGTKVHAQGGANSKRRTDAFEAAFSFAKDDGEEVITATGNFQRISLPGELTVTNYVVGNVTDVTPPGRITDLQVVDIFADGGNRNYTLKWTATGDDMSTGTCFGYEIRVSDSLDELLNNFTDAALLQVDSAVVPKASKLPETITVVVDATDSYTETAFCAIVAVDEAGNRGVVSNVVSVVVAKGYAVAASVAIGTHPPVDSDGATITIVLSTIGGAVVAVVLFGVVIYATYRRRVGKKKNTRVKEDIEEPPPRYEQVSLLDAQPLNCH